MNKDGNTILVPAVLILLSQTKVDILFKTKYIYSMHFYNLIVSFQVVLHKTVIIITDDHMIITSLYRL